MERSPADERRLVQKLLGEAFEIERTLGSGAQGVVYLAIQRSLDRQVVLKVCRAADGSQRAELRREADILQQVRHPSVVQLLDFGFAEQWVYLVYPFAPGQTLKDRLADAGTLEWKEAARIGLELAQGLAHVHSRGIIHRDIKPSNVWLPLDGAAQLIDFGTGFLETGPRLTAMGTIKATFPYAAPEQLIDGVIDRRADICSWGRMMFEMLHGSNPYLGDTVEECINRILNIPPGDLPPLPPQVPRRLDLLVRQSMEKDLEDRPQSALEIEDELARILQSHGAPGSRSGPIPTTNKQGTAVIERDKHQAGRVLSLDTGSVDEPQHRVLIGAVLVVLSLAMIGSLRRSPPPPPPPPVESTVSPAASPARAPDRLVGIVDLETMATQRTIHLRLRTLHPAVVELRVSPGDRRIPSTTPSGPECWHRFDFSAVPERRHEVTFVSPDGSVAFVPDRLEMRTIGESAFHTARLAAEKLAEIDGQIIAVMDRHDEIGSGGGRELSVKLNNRSELLSSPNPYIWTEEGQRIFEQALPLYSAGEVLHKDLQAFAGIASAALEPMSAVGRAAVQQLGRFLQPPPFPEDQHHARQRFMRTVEVVQALCRMGSPSALELVEYFAMDGGREWLEWNETLAPEVSELRRQTLRVIVSHRPAMARRLRELLSASSDPGDRITCEMVKMWQGIQSWSEWLAYVTSEDPELRNVTARILLETGFASPPPGMDWPWKPTVPFSPESAGHDAMLRGLWGGPVAASGLAAIEEALSSEESHQLMREETLISMGGAGETTLAQRLLERLQKSTDAGLRDAAGRGLLAHLFRERFGRPGATIEGQRSRDLEELSSNILRVVEIPAIAAEPDPGGARLMLRAICGAPIADPSSITPSVGPENYAWWAKGVAHLLAYRSATSDPENRLTGWPLVRGLVLDPLPQDYRGGVYLLDPGTSGVNTGIDVNAGDQIYLYAAGLPLEHSLEEGRVEEKVPVPGAGFQAGAIVGRHTIAVQWSDTPPFHLSKREGVPVGDSGRIRLVAGPFERDHFGARFPGSSRKYRGAILMRLEVGPRRSAVR